jgi:sulfoxide reductase heme-binding subunit YedZ
MNTGLRSTLSHWRHGIRLYIAIAIVLVSLEGWWWASVSYGGSNLFAIRLEELYAWLSLGLLAVAISIGPFYKIFNNAAGRSLMFDARRLLGIGAAWFAALHVTLVYSVQFRFISPLNLPGEYQSSFLVGTIALIVLLAMAFTSFDVAMKAMGIWWFRLHRLVYLAALMVLLHSFMIGVHALETRVLIMLGLLAAVIFGLEAAAIALRRKKPTKWQLLALIPALVLLAGIFNYAMAKRSDQDINKKYQQQVQKP